MASTLRRGMANSPTFLIESNAVRCKYGVIKIVIDGFTQDDFCPNRCPPTFGKAALSLSSDWQKLKCKYLRLRQQQNSNHREISQFHTRSYGIPTETDLAAIFEQIAVTIVATFTPISLRFSP